MDELMRAEQRLREVIQDLAQAPAGDKRNAAIEAARKALFDTQQAMIRLPPELRTSDVPMSDADYAKAMDDLKGAAQRLRESVQAMAGQPPGQRRNQAIDEANEAILEVNQAMMMIPWQRATAATGTSGTPGVSTATGGTAGSAATGTGATAGATGTGAQGLFDRIDANRDGVISRDEFAQQPQARGGLR
jgi:hypothetical protein